MYTSAAGSAPQLCAGFVHEPNAMTSLRRFPEPAGKHTAMPYLPFTGPSNTLETQPNFRPYKLNLETAKQSGLHIVRTKTSTQHDVHQSTRPPIEERPSLQRPSSDEPPAKRHKSTPYSKDAMAAETSIKMPASSKDPLLKTQQIPVF